MNVQGKGMAILLIVIALAAFWSCEQASLPVLADQESELTAGTIIE